MKFTDRSIAALKSDEERCEVWEDGRPGFGLRVGQKRKSWIYLYRFGGRPRRVTLGHYPAMSLADAHEAHAAAEKKLSKGLDPALEVLEQKQSERNAETVNELVDLYLEKWAKPRKKSWKEDERMLRKDIIPRFGRMKARDVRRGDIRAMLTELTERGCTVTANRTLAVTRKMFNWAVSEDILETSPCRGIAAPAAEKRRERVLQPAEIAKLWRGLDTCGMSESMVVAIKLMLLTAQRKGELATAAWKEINLDERWWTVPADKAKNEHSHRVPLTAMAVELFKDQKLRSGNSEWLFPSRVVNRGHIAPTAIDHAFYRARANLGIENVTPHDLRRTAASMMGSLGVPRLVIGKILNHMDSGVTAVYDRHSYDIEKRNAQETWEERLLQII